MDKYVELEHLADELESIASRLRALIHMENNLVMGVKMNIVASVRFLEDASVNGVRETVESPQMPCLLKDGYGYNWNITIDSKSGIIEGWPQGVTAKTWYKVCDMCKIIIPGHVHYDGTVPDFLALDEAGYNEYIYVTVDGMGKIVNWDEGKVLAWIKEHA